MRTLGAVLVLVAIVGFFYCTSHLSALDPVPEGTALGRYFEYDAGRYELGRYASAVCGLVGVLLSLFPKGR